MQMNGIATALKDFSELIHHPDCTSVASSSTDTGVLKIWWNHFPQDGVNQEVVPEIIPISIPTRLP